MSENSKKNFKKIWIVAAAAVLAVVIFLCVFIPLSSGSPEETESETADSSNTETQASKVTHDTLSDEGWSPVWRP
ncbi:MAG: hypothetical protein IJ303_00840 [Clostridia bacterium]|nr:hypothetical protein [Clostridia bacterium]